MPFKLCKISLSLYGGSHVGEQLLSFIQPTLPYNIYETLCHTIYVKHFATLCHTIYVKHFAIYMKHFAIYMKHFAIQYIRNTLPSIYTKHFAIQNCEKLHTSEAYISETFDLNDMKFGRLKKNSIFCDISRVRTCGSLFA